MANERHLLNVALVYEHRTGCKPCDRDCPFGFASSFLSGTSPKFVATNVTSTVQAYQEQNELWQGSQELRHSCFRR